MRTELELSQEVKVTGLLFPDWSSQSDPSSDWLVLARCLALTPGDRSVDTSQMSGECHHQSACLHSSRVWTFVMLPMLSDLW